MKTLLYLSFKIFGTYLGVGLCLSSCYKVEFGADFGYSGCLGCDPYAGSAPNSVSIYNSSFLPDSMSVQKGTTIRWINFDWVEHNVISEDGTSFNSGVITLSGEYNLTTDAVGSFLYHCDKHGESGKFVVIP